MMRFFLILMILFPVGLLFAGFRVHPENLPLYFQQRPTEMVRLDTASGKTVVGELVEKKGDTITVNIAGAEVPFTAAEIIDMRELTEEEIKQAYADGLIFEAQKKPLFSYEKGESIFKKFNFVNALIDEQERIGAIVEKNSPRKQQIRALQEAQMKAAEAKRRMMQQMQRAHG